MIRGGAATAIAIALSSTPAIAQPVQQYEISEQGLDAALKTFAAVSGSEVIAPREILIGKRSRTVYGAHSAAVALARRGRKSVGSGKVVSVSVDIGGGRIINKKKTLYS